MLNLGALICSFRTFRMRDSSNPYQTPQASLPPFVPETLRGVDSIWRDGSSLVVEKNALLPPFCVKTDSPDIKFFFKTYLWYGSFIGLRDFRKNFLVNLTAMAFGRRQAVAVPLSRREARRRTRQILQAWLGALTGSFVGIGTLMWAFSQTHLSYGQSVSLLPVSIGAFILLVAATLYGQAKSAILKPVKMTASMTWFHGACEAYLNRFPELPEELCQ